MPVKVFLSIKQHVSDSKNTPDQSSLSTIIDLRLLWRGAKETAEFCRFWRFSASATRDWNGGIIAGFL